jgi:hypothetical protein
MYLDDGVSRESAPCRHVPSAGSGYGVPRKHASTEDPLASDKYCEVIIQQVCGTHWITYVPTNLWSQKTTRLAADNSPLRLTRAVTINAPWNGFGDLSPMIGARYTVIFWHEQTTPLSSIELLSSSGEISTSIDTGSRATIATVPVADAHTLKGIVVHLTHDAPL